MRLPIKMYLIIILSASLVLYQCHTSNLQMLSQSPSSSSQDFNKDTKLNNASSSYFDCSLCLNSNLKTVTSAENYSLPPLYIITPTYRRAEQIAELTRLAQTLMLVKNVRWLVIEDAVKKSPIIAKLLARTKLQYEHLIAPMPKQYKLIKGGKPRGVSNRNCGIKWIRNNHIKDGVFYFADDDNSYDLRLFEEIRYTKQVSMFPVGLITQLGVSSPIVKDGKLIGFYDGFMAGRKFPVDMAGFAVSVKFLLERPNAKMPFQVGFEEDGFLKSLSPLEPKDIELLATNCTEVLVWHTQTKKNPPSKELDLSKHNNTNLVLLKEFLV